MAVLVAVVLILVILRICDDICFMRRIGDFERKASEFSTMYQILTPKVLHGNPEEPDVVEFLFKGENFLATVEKGNLKSLYSQLNLALCEVQDSYDKIGERYLESMDEESAEYIEELHSIIERISSEVRYQMWLNGIKQQLKFCKSFVLAELYCF